MTDSWLAQFLSGGAEGSADTVGFLHDANAVLNPAQWPINAYEAVTGTDVPWDLDVGKTANTLQSAIEPYTAEKPETFGGKSARNVGAFVVPDLLSLGIGKAAKVPMFAAAKWGDEVAAGLGGALAYTGADELAPDSTLAKLVAALGGARAGTVAKDIATEAVTDPRLLARLADETGAIGDLDNIDLPMDEASRLERARELGFETNEVLYHGTRGDFDEMDTMGRGKTYGSGAFFSDDPDIAETYSGPQGNILPVYTKPGKELVIDVGGGNWDDFTEGKMFVETPDGDEELFDFLNIDIEPDDYLTTDDLGRIAREQGYDSVYLKGVTDEGAYDIATQRKISEFLEEEYDLHGKGLYSADVDEDMREEAMSYARDNLISNNRIVMNPQNIRSVFAAFDPTKKDSANLLAGLGGLSILGAMTGQNPEY